MILRTPCPPLKEFLGLGFGHLARCCEMHRAFGGLEGFKGLESVLHLIIPSDMGVKLFAGYGVFEGKGGKCLECSQGLLCLDGLKCLEGLEGLKVPP